MSNAGRLASAALTANKGVLRLAPNWVPRSFLVPGRRMRLHPDDLYALGTHRGGIDERWFSSCIAAANEGAPPDEGLSYVVAGNERVLLKDAIADLGAQLVGEDNWKTYKRWPVFAKYFDNMGPIPHHMHQNDEQAKLVGQESKPEAYYYPPQLNPVLNNFPYTFFGLEPGTKKEQVIACLDRWNKGDNGILDLSKAYRLKLGTGWLIPPCVLHAPGSLLTFEPQWASDIFSMFQSIVEDRVVDRKMLAMNFPKEHQHDNTYIANSLDWAGNVNPNFKDSHYMEPIAVADTAKDGYLDKWIVYGKVNGKQLFTAKELTINPGVKVTVKDTGAYGIVVIQGTGKMNGLAASAPSVIRFGQMTEDEFFVSPAAAAAGVTFENTGSEPLVTLRYFGPNANPTAPNIGDYRR